MFRIPRVPFVCGALLFAGCSDKTPTNLGDEFPKPGVSVCYKDCSRQAPAGFIRVDTLSNPGAVEYGEIANVYWLAGQIERKRFSTAHRYAKFTIRLWMVVPENGKTAHVGLLESSGIPEIDRIMVDVLSYALWHPHAYDGDPAALAFDMPIRYGN